MKIVKSTLFSALVLSTLSLGGCMTKDLVNHSFEFNARDESPDIEVLNYQYGNSNQASARVSQWILDQGTPLGRTSIGGPMLRGDFLYVKWRIKATGEVIEDTVDLRDRLPKNIEKHRIYFVVKERQLYVYLITPKPYKIGFPTYNPPGYSHLITYQIYPGQPKF